MVTESQVLDSMRHIIDPDLGRDIVSLGFIKNLEIEGGTVRFSVELTTPACPVKEHFKKAWKDLNISYDYFVRTTDARHQKAVEELLSVMHDATTGDDQKVVYPGEYSGLYCVGCEKFITQKELVDGLCPDHLQEPKKVSEKNYFFRLSSYLKQVGELIRDDKLKISPEERKR